MERSPIHSRSPGMLLAFFVLVPLLSGCLTSKGGDSISYTMEVYGELETVRSYHANGTVSQTLGVGITATEAGPWGLSEDGDFVVFGDSGLLVFPPSENIPIDLGRNQFLNDSDLVIEHGEDDVGGPFVGVTRDSTYWFIADRGILIPVIVVVARHAGFPCTLSRPRAFQIVTNPSVDTIPVAVTQVRLDRTVIARLSVMIDTTASRTADDRVDFKKSITALIDVTCPEP